jgi:hypothetical protein
VQTPNRYRLGLFSTLAGAAVIWALGATSARAGTLIPMNLQTLSDHAGQVIVGEVVSVDSYWTTNPRNIESKVTLQNVKYLKGRLPGSASTFELTVPGGTVGEMQMRICCAPVFIAGDKWVVFLLPTYRTFPVVGLSQGAFRVLTDADGVERVHNAWRGPVTGFDAQGFVRVAGKRKANAHRHLAAAGNARLKDGGRAQESPDEPMTFREFLTKVRPVLARSKAHNLSQPAGRRGSTTYAAEPLKPATTRPAANHIRAKALTGKPDKSPGRNPRGAVKAAPSAGVKNRGRTRR